jgi:hypothetical protein
MGEDRDGDREMGNGDTHLGRRLAKAVAAVAILSVIAAPQALADVGGLPAAVTSPPVPAPAAPAPIPTPAAAVAPVVAAAPVAQAAAPPTAPDAEAAAPVVEAAATAAQAVAQTAAPVEQVVREATQATQPAVDEVAQTASETLQPATETAAAVTRTTVPEATKAAGKIAKRATEVVTTAARTATTATGEQRSLEAPARVPVAAEPVAVPTIDELRPSTPTPSAGSQETDLHAPATTDVTSPSVTTKVSGAPRNRAAGVPIGSSAPATGPDITIARGEDTRQSSRSGPRLPDVPSGPLQALLHASASGGAGALVLLLAALAGALFVAAPGLGRWLRPRLAPWPQPIPHLSLERPG